MRILLPFQRSNLDSCITIFQLPISCIASLGILLSSCGPASTNNYYTTPPANSGYTNGTGSSQGGGGTGDGGGGQGVQCGSTKDPKFSNRLFVRDIYEATYNHNRQMKTVSNSTSSSNVSQEAIRVLTSSLQDYLGPASANLEFAKDNFWAEFYKKISFIDDDKQLRPSIDANSPIVLPKGCEIVQIAFWEESSGAADDGILYVDRKHWERLDQLNKIALLAHEFFFMQARKALYKNSDSVRLKVGELLSTKGISPLFKNWVPATNKIANLNKSLPENRRGFKYCTGTSPDDPTASIQLYQYEGSDKKQHFVIPKLTSRTINSSYFQNSDFTFDFNDRSLMRATDLLYYHSAFRFDPDENYPIGQVDEDDYAAPALRGVEFATNSFEEGMQRSFNFWSMMLSGQKEVLWTNFLTSSARIIKVSFLNTSSRYSKDYEQSLKPQEQFIKIAQTEIRKELKKYKFSATETADFLTNLQNLLIEFHESGNESGDETKNDSDFFFRIEQLAPQFKNKIQNDAIKKRIYDLAGLWFVLQFEFDGDRDILRILKSLDINLPNPMPRALKFRVTQDSELLNFDLDCDSYNWIYLKLHQKYMGDLDKIFTANKNSQAVFVQEPPKSLKDDTQIAKYKTENENLKKMAAYLRFPDQAPETLSYPKFVSMFMFGCDVGPEYKCSHLRSFFIDLKAESNIKVERCSSEPLEWKTDYSKLAYENCALITTNSTGNIYQVFYKYYDNVQFPAVNSVKLIGHK